MSYTIGDRYWIPDDDDAWLVGTLKSGGSTMLEFSTEKGIQKIRISDLKNVKLETCGSHIEDNVENLVDLDELSEGAILHHTRVRFQKKIIYTHVGSILVAVNPFERLDIYSDRDIRRAFSASHPYPHVFVSAANAYQQLNNNLKNQSVLISGESGAGKTETTKKVLTFLTNVAPDGGGAKKATGEVGMEDKILQSNPLLEALGNAKTLRNNNSSRFGKWMKVGFNNNFRIQGCEIVNYLLEKSRVVGQNEKERNYHFFYQLIAGVDGSLRERLQLKPPSEFHYLNQSGCSIIEGVDDAAEFEEVVQAMHTLQFSQETMDQLFQAVAGILFLGNIAFDQGKDAESSMVSSKSSETLHHCAQLLGANVDMFTFSLTEKKVQMGRGSIVSIALSTSQAEENRDTIAKTLYSNLFDWTIRKVNTTLQTPQPPPYSIGILDIFGFEVFEVNSFEQLCINYANEKLQFHFNEVIFKEETAMYQSEGVPTEAVVFEDNALCVALIEGKPFGLLSLLEEECSLGNATDLSYISKVDKAFGVGKPQTNKFFVKNKVKPECFSVCHFAGAVEYNINNFLDKNRDTLSMTAHEVMATSATPLVAELFAPAAEDAEAGDASAASSGRGGGGSGKKKSTKSTLGGQFRGQLIGLLATLNATEPHFIRCVKPNHQKVGGIFDGNLALRQLRYAGLFEAIRIRKSGYAYRAAYKVFANSYQILVDGLTLRRQSNETSDADACREILETVTAEQLIEGDCWVVGTTRVFLKTNAHRTKLERHKVARVTVFAERIQALAMKFLLRMRAKRVVAALRRERDKALFELAAFAEAAVVVQKYWRRAQVLMMMQSMQKLIELRRVLARREVSRIKELLSQIDEQRAKLTGESSAAAKQQSPKKSGGKQQPQQQQKRGGGGGGGGSSENVLATLFDHEVKVARVMVRLMEIQEKLVQELTLALDFNDAGELNRLLVKAEKLEMSTHPLVLKAKEQLMRMHEKCRIMQTMVAFLKSEEEYTETILHTLNQAKEYDIDEEFIAQVHAVYESAGPRLKTRNRLRHVVETIDRYGIEQTCLEVLNIQLSQPAFAESELRAAKAMLRLLAFDAELQPDDDDYDDDEEEEEQEEGEEEKDGAESGESIQAVPERSVGEGGRRDGAETAETTAAKPTLLWGRPLLKRPTYPKLNRELLEVCVRILRAKNPSAEVKEKKKLLEMAGSVERLNDIIRYYKWSNTLCTWRYPEVLAAEAQMRARHAGTVNASNDNNKNSASSSSNESKTGNPSSSSSSSSLEGEFYGLRPVEARSSAHIIRTLHKDFDAITGAASVASMEAALGSVELRSSVAETLANLEELSNIDVNPRLPNGNVFQKTLTKHPRKNVPTGSPLKSPTSTPSKAAGGGSSKFSSTTPTTTAANAAATGGGGSAKQSRTPFSSASAFSPSPSPSAAPISPATGLAVRRKSYSSAPTSDRKQKIVQKAPIPTTRGKKTLTSLEKELQATRDKKSKLAMQADRHMDLAKKSSEVTRKGWK